MKRTLSTLTAAALAFSLAACGSDSDDNEPAASENGLQTVAAGKLTICSDLPYAPFEYEDPDSPSGFGGFDMDIVQYVADAVDLELVVKPTAFTPIQSGAALNASQCDIGASAITIDEVRAKKIDFSDPYFDSVQSLLVPEGSDIEGIDDLEGKKVGVQESTTGAQYARANATESAITDYDDDGKLFQALKANLVDAILQDFGPNKAHEDAGGFTIVESFETDEQYGLAIKKGNSELLEAVNDALSEMRESGKYDEVHSKYFS